MKKAELLALAARVEAEGPSRELDWLIAVQIGQAPQGYLPTKTALAHSLITAFTSSIDAAVTLKPKNVYRSGTREGDGINYAWMLIGPSVDMVKAYHENEAAARTAAALKAMAEVCDEG